MNIPGWEDPEQKIIDKTDNYTKNKTLNNFERMLTDPSVKEFLSPELQKAVESEEIPLSIQEENLLIKL